MSEKYTFAILGGDMRQITVAKLLLSLGHSVSLFGLNDVTSGSLKAEYCLTAKKAIEGADAVILPLPVSRNGKYLNTTGFDCSEQVSLEEIINMTSKNSNKLILGGMIPQCMKEKAELFDIKLKDYYACEDLQKKNALPSAEGALMLAMENSDTVIEGMNALVTGYGKTGMLISEKLRSLGARVSVAARRDEVLCEIAMSGFKPIRIDNEKELAEAFEKNEVIFNTVPHIIFTKKILNSQKNKPLYIEIASAPGGIDIPAARGMGVQMIFAPSLPGKYAPISAGRYIFETICDLLKEGGMKI